MTDYKTLANAIRFLSMDAVEKAGSGHPGMPMGMADVATVLVADFLKFYPLDAAWWGRDRLILSNGHGSMLQYALLYLLGYPQMTLDELKNFRQLGSHTPGHPEVETEGVETTTGPLGQGLANGVGMAMAARILNHGYPGDLFDTYTYVFAGDGCLMEGITQEAISFAGHQKLNKLIVLFDDNGITIDGKTDQSTSDNHKARFEAVGWEVQQIDGHDHLAIKKALKVASVSDRPSLIACRTHIGFGAPNKQGQAIAHGAPLGTEEIAATREGLGWPHDPFHIPAEILTTWRAVGAQHETTYRAWQKRFNSLKEETRAQLKAQMQKQYKPNWQRELRSKLQEDFPIVPAEATRASSYHVLTHLVREIPFLIGGSADLSGSNLTYLPLQKFHEASSPTGTYINYGIREHAMGGIMNGLALYGGFLPYGGTFLVFSDYMRPAIRLAALMKCQVIYVFTHDSIGVGEDGPTHQPVEQLMSLRLIPNMCVIRPADLVETMEAWEIAVNRKNGPTALVLTRQRVAAVSAWREENKTAKGGYVVAEEAADLWITLIATGSEVSLAAEVKNAIGDVGTHVRVVSMPCITLFLEQKEAYQQEVLGPRASQKVVIEAGRSWGWEKVVGRQGIILGIESFGASAPGEKVYEHFGLTAQKISERLKKIAQERGEEWQ